MVFGFGSKKKKDKDAPESSADAAKAAQSGRNRRLSIFSSKKDKDKASAVDELFENMTISPPSVQNVRSCVPLSCRRGGLLTVCIVPQVNFDVAGGIRVAERADPTIHHTAAAFRGTQPGSRVVVRGLCRHR